MEATKVAPFKFPYLLIKRIYVKIKYMCNIFSKSQP